MQLKNFHFKNNTLSKKTNLAKSKFTIVLTFLFLLYYYLYVIEVLTVLV